MASEDSSRKRPAGADAAAEEDGAVEDNLTLAEFAKRHGITVRRDPLTRRPAAAKKARTSAGSKAKGAGGATPRVAVNSSASAVLNTEPWVAPEQQLPSVAVSRILIRWNHCIEWPDPAEVAALEAKRKRGYRALPGYPGVYVGIRTDVIGEYDVLPLSDLQFGDFKYRPTRKHLMQLPLPKILVLWETACRNQLPHLQRLVDAGDSYGDRDALVSLKRELKYVQTAVRRMQEKVRERLASALKDELERCRQHGGWNVSFVEQQLAIARGDAAE